MPKVAPVMAPIPDVLKALSDEMRWSIVAQMSAVDELACTRLEHTLPVSKPTISYHIKVLYHAGLIEVRKEGRNYYYRLRRDVLDGVLGEIAEQLGLAGGRSAGGDPETRQPHASRSTVAADETGIGRVGEATATSRASRAGRAARSA